MTGPCDRSSGVDALVSGKRRAPRVPVRLPARIRSLHAEFDAFVHDLSRNGALVGVSVSAVPDVARGPLGPAEQFQLLERHFRDSFDLTFVRHDIVVEAQVVRLVVSGGHGRLEELKLGCHFVCPLTARQQAVLGLIESDTTVDAWGEAVARHHVHLFADPARPVAAFLLDERSGVAGPPYVGAVRAVGPRALTVRLVGVTRREVREYMAAAPARVRVLRGPRELWTIDADLVEVRYCDQAAPGVEVLFATREALPRAVRRHFRRA